MHANKGLKEIANCLFPRGTTNSCVEDDVAGKVSRPSEQRTIRFGVASNPEFLREGSAVATDFCSKWLKWAVARSAGLQVGVKRFLWSLVLVPRGMFYAAYF